VISGAHHVGGHGRACGLSNGKGSGVFDRVNVSRFRLPLLFAPTSIGLFMGRPGKTGGPSDNHRPARSAEPSDEQTSTGLWSVNLVEDSGEHDLPRLVAVQDWILRAAIPPGQLLESLA
jgi:hypothetical protein